MINPCKSNKSYILGNSIYNITNPSNPRYSLPYVKPTPDMYLKHKQLILKYSTLTNGPGGVTNDISFKQLSYKLNIDSVQFNNTIYKIPCRFRPYINDGYTWKEGTIIRLLKEGKSIQKVFQILTETYNIPDPTLTSTNIYQFQRLYTYPQINFNTNTITVRPSTNTIDISYRTRFVPAQDSDLRTQFLFNTTDGITPSINWHTILNLPDNIFPVATNCQFIEVLNNDGKTFTSNYKDLYGSASYLGGELIQTPEYTPNVPPLPVLLLPQEQNRPKIHGYIVNTRSVPQYVDVSVPPMTDIDTQVDTDYIVFIPVQTTTSIIYFESYPTNMAFTIKPNSVLTIPKIDCYIKTRPPFVNK
jgi:hypothetical protein